MAVWVVDGGREVHQTQGLAGHAAWQQICQQLGGVHFADKGCAHAFLKPGACSHIRTLQHALCGIAYRALCISDANPDVVWVDMLHAVKHGAYAVGIQAAFPQLFGTCQHLCAVALLADFFVQQGHSVVRDHVQAGRGLLLQAQFEDFPPQQTQCNGQQCRKAAKYQRNVGAKTFGGRAGRGHNAGGRRKRLHRVRVARRNHQCMRFASSMLGLVVVKLQLRKRCIKRFRARWLDLERPARQRSQRRNNNLPMMLCTPMARACSHKAWEFALKAWGWAARRGGAAMPSALQAAATTQTAPSLQPHW